MAVNVDGEEPKVKVSEEEEIDLKTSSLRTRGRKSSRKYAFWRYKKAKEAEQEQKAEEEAKQEKETKEIPTPVLLSRESTFRVSGKKDNKNPHATHEVTGGIIAPRSRSASPNKAAAKEGVTSEDELEKTTEEEAHTIHSPVSRAERVSV